MFEGVYLNGKRWTGKGIEIIGDFDNDDHIINRYKGELLNGQRNGKGI